MLKDIDLVLKDVDRVVAESLSRLLNIDAHVATNGYGAKQKTLQKTRRDLKDIDRQTSNRS